MDEVLHAIECDCQECLDKWAKTEDIMKYKPNSSHETLWNREERYILNKIRSEYLEKIEIENG